jgi:hypothetical protein
VASQTGIIAWALRDFVDVEFISDVNEARGDEIVVALSEEVVDLGGSYVGQDFVLRRDWSLQALTPVDLLAWWTQRRVGASARDSTQTQSATLWLRQDIYNGAQDEAQVVG